MKGNLFIEFCNNPQVLAGGILILPSPQWMGDFRIPCHLYDGKFMKE